MKYNLCYKQKLEEEKRKKMPESSYVFTKQVTKEINLKLNTF